MSLESSVPACLRLLSDKRAVVVAVALLPMVIMDQAGAVDVATTTPSVFVTATKLPSDVAVVPAMVSIVTGEELRARGARDLRTALLGVAGVDIAPGGDAGPASSVPGMWGLREFDAFLLVVDGVPYGGAFNPALTTLDLTNVLRIEVLRGAAPVMYGATSFVGVIHVIHAPAGQGGSHISVAGGTRGTTFADYSSDLPQIGQYQHSLVINGERRDFSQDDSQVERLHALYRGSAEIAGGQLRADVDLTTLRQDPYSPHPREGTALSARFPLDSNVNPSDAKQDQDRAQLNLAFEGELGIARSATMLSFAHTESRNVRGFLREDFATDGVTPNSDGFRQTVRLTDMYFDSYLAFHPQSTLTWIAGIDWLHGRGSQRSANFEYAALVDGSNRPDSHALTIDESTELEVERDFVGLYSQVEWQPVERLRLTGGLRLNRTQEKHEGGEVAADGSESEGLTDRRSETRLSGIFGVDYRLWQREGDYLTTFANYRDTFKPAAVDFGPEAEAKILRPEGGRSVELGLRGRMLDERLTWEASAFRMDFENLVIRENVAGLPGLANAGKQRFKGAEFEARYRLFGDFNLFASYAWHQAVFTDYARVRPDNSLQQLAGKSLELSPRHLGTLGLVHAPAEGWVGSIAWSYTGSRYLNKGNTALASGFSLIDAGIGYRWRGWELRVDGINLTDRRDPVAESELGDAQFYRLPGRAVWASITLKR